MSLVVEGTEHLIRYHFKQDYFHKELIILALTFASAFKGLIIYALDVFCVIDTIVNVKSFPLKVS